jgi:hypothetical protein
MGYMSGVNMMFIAGYLWICEIYCGFTAVMHQRWRACILFILRYAGYGNDVIAVRAFEIHFDLSGVSV